MKHVGECPAFEVAIISCNGNIGENAKNPNVFPEPSFIHGVKDKWGGVIAQPAAKPTH
jgi:hypothetical protein